MVYPFRMSRWIVERNATLNASDRLLQSFDLCFRKTIVIVIDEGVASGVIRRINVDYVEAGSRTTSELREKRPHYREVVPVDYAMFAPNVRWEAPLINTLDRDGRDRFSKKAIASLPH